MRPSALDKLFGGKPGDADKAKQAMQRSYGRDKGLKVFDATVIKRERKAKRAGKR